MGDMGAYVGEVMYIWVIYMGENGRGRGGE